MNIQEAVSKFRPTYKIWPSVLCTYNHPGRGFPPPKSW